MSCSVSSCGCFWLCGVDKVIMFGLLVWLCSVLYRKWLLESVGLFASIGAEDLTRGDPVGVVDLVKDCLDVCVRRYGF